MCKHCEEYPVYEFTNKRKLCKQCFVRYFTKKFLYTIRKFEMIKREDIICFKSSGSLRDVVLEKMLDYFSEKAGVEIVKSSKKNCSIAVSDTLDATSLAFISQTFGKDKKDLLPVIKNKIKPLYLFLDKEVLLYAKILKLKHRSVYPKLRSKGANLEMFIDGLEENHPEIKRAIVNSYLELFG